MTVLRVVGKVNHACDEVELKWLSSAATYVPQSLNGIVAFLFAAPRSRGPVLVVFVGGHTHLHCFISLSPLCFKPAHKK